MKALIAIVVLAGVAAVVGAIYVGARVAEPTVVPDPYTAGLHHDEARHAHDAARVGARAPPACDLARAPCARQAGVATVTLELRPRPPRAMSELTFTVSVAPADAVGAGPARIALTMPGMYMGENVVALAPAGAARWEGRGVVVRCPSGRRTWEADVELPPRVAGQPSVRTAFSFDAAEP